jgi:hypothetical protein
MKKAIDYRINHDILREFLKTHTSEAMNMLLTEWNTAKSSAPGVTHTDPGTPGFSLRRSSAWRPSPPCRDRMPPALFP